jgi:predicted nucleic acid-binding Zn ribbon protein
MTLAVRKPAAPKATGHYLNCGEPLSEGRRWCDTDCRDDWQRMESDRRRRAEE